MPRNYTTAYVHKGTQFEFFPSPTLCASCNDCCIVQSNSACADPELVSGGGWSCMLLLHPTLTCADSCLDLCTLCLRWLSPAATCVVVVVYHKPEWLLWIDLARCHPSPLPSHHHLGDSSANLFLMMELHSSSSSTRLLCCEGV